MRRKVRLTVLLSVVAMALAICLEGFLRQDGIVASVILATRTEIPREQIFGKFHLVMLALTLIIATLVAIFGRKIPDSVFDDAVFFGGVALFVMEIYKQLYYHIAIGNGSYNFAILPLQLCSYALYFFLLVPLLPSGRVKNALYSFCGLYLTMGACIVMGYPTLYADVALNLHTMLWHMLMVAVGVLILVKRRLGRRIFSETIPAGIVFLITITVATVVNVTVTPYTSNSLGKLNLFYMSPYIPTHYVIIGDVWKACGWFPSLLTYIGLFVFVGAPLVWLVAMILNISKK